MNNCTIIKSTAYAFAQLEKLGHLFCRLTHIVSLADHFLMVWFDLFMFCKQIFKYRGLTAFGFDISLEEYFLDTLYLYFLLHHLWGHNIFDCYFWSMDSAGISLILSLKSFLSTFHLMVSVSICNYCLDPLFHWWLQNNDFFS